MKPSALKRPRIATIALTILVVLGIVVAGYLVERLGSEEERFAALEAERDTLRLELASSTDSLVIASSTIALLETELDDLREEYGVEQGRNEDFEKQIKKISKTVGVLDKLSKTDEELLQKYSKVYFLNEHYIPEKLASVEKEYMYDESKNHQLHSKVLPYFNDLVKDAKEDGVDLWVVSSYRSFEQQATLKGQYLVTYGSGANTFSADQGYSEHQLGTTVDFTTKGLGGGLSGFSSTPAYTWLQQNAYKYGFTLSYPENNGYYEFEPWHWRFVGEDLARDLNKANATFYDWDQRKIDGYLISIFD